MTNGRMTDNNKEQDSKKYIELNIFIKIQGLAATGGQAKMLIRSGNIILNGTPETRNKKKLYDGDVVEIEGKKYVVKI
ncbi:MAG: RNA-binding S4 domain-containing protein [Candidatus Woesearchaeota archaeon]